VVVIKAVSRSSPLSGRLEADVHALEAEGTQVAVIEPDDANSELIRTGPVDPANRRPAAKAGLRQSADVVQALPAWVRQL
jgi:hypothetical protein